MIKIAIFASGSGSNAAVILETLPELLQGKSFKISLVLTNNAKSGVLEIAHKYNIPTEIILLKNKDTENISLIYTALMQQYAIDFIILAGYLKKIPTELTVAYPKRIVNIHPALLPAYGGAGMYGKYVHQAVIAAGEKESGITVHFVDEVYDHGQIIFQTKCFVEAFDTAGSLAAKILQLEHSNYTKVIAGVLLSQNHVK